MNKEEFIYELKKINVELDSQSIENLEKYYNILVEENKKYNLTRIIDKEDVYLKHFYDSLTITKVTKISDKIICDLGSGAGFPGFVLAICFPTSKLTLIESNGKKTKFLNIVKEKLSLKNVTIINTRVEEYAKDNREIFDIVTARAVAPLKHLLEYGIPLVKIDGNFIAMKAKINKEENNIENYYKKLNINLLQREEFSLPKNQGIRTLLKYHKTQSTNIKYPRRYSEIIKKDI